MGSEIKGNGEALLPGGEVAPVESVRIFRGGKAGILPDGPGLRRIHSGGGAAEARWLAGIGGEEVEPGKIVFAIARLHRDTFGRGPGWNAFLSGGHRRVREVDVGKIRDLTHFTPRLSWAARKVESTSQPT